MKMNMKFKSIDSILEGQLSAWIHCTEQALNRIRGKYVHTLGIVSQPNKYGFREEIDEPYEAIFYYPDTIISRFLERSLKSDLLEKSLIEYFEAQGFSDVRTDYCVNVDNASYLFITLFQEPGNELE